MRQISIIIRRSSNAVSVLYLEGAAGLTWLIPDQVLIKQGPIPHFLTLANEFMATGCSGEKF